MVFLPNSPLHALFFHTFSKKCSPPLVGSTFLKIGPHHFALKVSLFRRRTGPNKAHVGNSVWSYRSVVRSFPLLSAPCLPSRISKTSQICVLLLQVASLDDFSDASDMILITSSCVRAPTDALHPPTYGFFVQVSAACIVFHIFSKKRSPPSVGSTCLKIGPHHFASKI